MEYNRLVLEGRDQSYEENPARNQMLTFQKLEQELIRVMGIGKLNQDILKTLELYTDKDGFNIAAELLADKNGFPGVEIVDWSGFCTTVVISTINTSCVEMTRAIFCRDRLINT